MTIFDTNCDIKITSSHHFVRPRRTGDAALRAGGVGDGQEVYREVAKTQQPAPHTPLRHPLYPSSITVVKEYLLGFRSLPIEDSSDWANGVRDDVGLESVSFLSKLNFQSRKKLFNTL